MLFLECIVKKDMSVTNAANDWFNTIRLVVVNITHQKLLLLSNDKQTITNEHKL